VPIGRDGTLRPVLDRIDALDDVPASLERLEAGGTRGKVVIDVAGGAGHTDRPVASGMHVHE
jgi:hypothetical protein